MAENGIENIYFTYPVEIWEKIISFIDMRDIQALACTCRFFKEITESTYIWKYQCIKLLHYKNVTFDSIDFPIDLNFKSTYKRIARISFIFPLRSNLDFPYNCIIPSLASINNLTVIMKNYIHLHLQWSGQTIDKDFINEIAIYKLSLDCGINCVVMYTPFHMNKYPLDVLKNHIKYSVPLIFTESTARCFLIIPSMLSPYLLGTDIYLTAQLSNVGLTFAIVLNGEIQEHSYNHLPLLEESTELHYYLKNGTIDTWTNAIKDTLNMYSPSVIADCLLKFYVNFDHNNPEFISIFNIIKKKLNNIYQQHVETIQFDFTDSSIQYNLECAAEMLNEILLIERICPEKCYNPFRIGVIDFKEFILYGTDFF